MNGSHYKKYSGGHFDKKWELWVVVGEWFASTESLERADRLLQGKQQPNYSLLPF